jgi:hypothetical protein
VEQSVNTEERLQRIAAIYGIKRKVGDIMVDSDVLLNLDGAIIDIERTRKIDDVSLRTLKRVRDQLREIGEILGFPKGRRTFAP